ncbi:hypothetical protein SCB29_22640 [Paraburkholderia sp. SIMBA_055]
MNNCHDWTLIGLSVNWLIGELQIEMLDESSMRRVWIGSDLVSLILPRQHPWGPSVSINKVEVSTGDAVTAKFEMQSGDVIECVVRSFILQ